MIAARRDTLRIVVALCALIAVAVGGGACGATHSASSPGAPTATADLSNPDPSTPSAALSAPKTTAAQDAEFLSDITEADPALVSYEQSQGSVALRALLTDGSAFCAFLQRGGGIDNAMVDVAVGARSVETQTHLPESVTTFNAIESVSLLTLCPSYQSLLPASDRSKIRALGEALANQSD